MILTQTHKRRSFVGSLNVGTDVVDALRSLCVDNTILCGFFQGSGYLKDVKLRTYDAVTRTYRDPVVHPGTFHAVSLSGSISLIERQTSIRCHLTGAVLAPGASAAVAASGEVVSAEVINLEFSLDSIDDIRLYRAKDDRSGLESWLHVEFAQGGAPIRPPERAPAIDIIAPPRPPRAAEGSFDIRDGDFLNHPTLGRCIVAGPEVDERITIKLESGRLVELHTGLIDITPAKPGPGGERVFTVSIKRRR
ncbi:MAG: DUF296 domain-containing protein [Myxococcota bacterium]